MHYGHRCLVIQWRLLVHPLWHADLSADMRLFQSPIQAAGQKWTHSAG